jgi:hypothetical protein
VKELLIASSLKVLEPPSSLQRLAEYRKKMMIDHEGSVVLASVSENNSPISVDICEQPVSSAHEILDNQVQAKSQPSDSPVSLTLVSDPFKLTPLPSNGRKLNLECVAVRLPTPILVPSKDVTQLPEPQLVPEQDISINPEVAVKVSISTASVVRSGIDSPVSFPLEGPTVCSGVVTNNNEQGYPECRNVIASPVELQEIVDLSGAPVSILTDRNVSPKASDITSMVSGSRQPLLMEAKSKKNTVQKLDHATKSPRRKPIVVNTENPLTNYFKPVSITVTADDDEIDSSRKGNARTIHLSVETSGTNVSRTLDAEPCLNNLDTTYDLQHTVPEHTQVLEDSHVPSVTSAEVAGATKENDVECGVPVWRRTLSPVKVVVEKVEDFILTKTFSALETTPPLKTEHDKELPSTPLKTEHDKELPSHEAGGSSRRKIKNPLKRNPGDPKLPPFKHNSEEGKARRKRKVKKQVFKKGTMDKLDLKTSVQSAETPSCNSGSEVALPHVEIHNTRTGPEEILSGSQKISDSEDVIESSQDSGTSSVIVHTLMPRCSVSLYRIDNSLRPGSKINVSHGDQKLMILTPQNSSSAFKIYTPDKKILTAIQQEKPAKAESQMEKTHHLKLLSATRSLCKSACVNQMDSVQDVPNMSSVSNSKVDESMKESASKLSAGNTSATRSSVPKLKSEEQTSATKFEGNISEVGKKCTRKRRYKRQINASVSNSNVSVVDNENTPNLRSRKRPNISKSVDVVLRSIKKDTPKSRSKKLINISASRDNVPPSMNEDTPKLLANSSHVALEVESDISDCVVGVSKVKRLSQNSENVCEKSVCGTSPVSTEKSVCDMSPVSTEKSVCDMSPLSTEKSVCDTSPVSTEKSVCDTSAVSAEKSVCDTGPVSTEKSVCDMSPVSTEKSVCDASPVSTEKSVCGTSPVSTPSGVKSRSSTLSDSDKSPSPSSPKFLLNSPRSLLRAFSSPLGSLESNQNQKSRRKNLAGGRGQYMVGLAVAVNDVGTSQVSSPVATKKSGEVNSIIAATPPSSLARKRLLDVMSDAGTESSLVPLDR